MICGIETIEPEGAYMRTIGAAFVLTMLAAWPAAAADMPTRKPGLWDIKMSFEGRAGLQAIQQCIDVATDQMLQSGAGPVSRAACSKRDVQRSGNSITIDSACTIGGKATTTHSVITGSFDSAYTMTVTSQSDSAPGGGKTTMTIAAKWLGPCAADQKPGDMIMANGVKTNILNMQKGITSPGSPPPP